MNPWIPVGISLCGMLLGGSGFVAAIITITRFSTRMSVTLDQLSEAINKLTVRMDNNERSMQGSVTDRAEMNIKLSQVQSNTEGLSGMREKWAADQATNMAAHSECRRRMDRVESRLEEVFHQLSAIASGSANRILEFPSRS